MYVDLFIQCLLWIRSEMCCLTLCFLLLFFGLCSSLFPWN